VAGANLSLMDTRITMRWTPEIDAISSKWRLRYKNIIYDVTSIAPIDMNRREVEILAKSGTNQG
jgi:head-tail adaptor